MNSTEHQHNTYTSHSSSIEHRPQRTPNAKRRPSDDRKADMIRGSDSSRHTDEGARDSITKPNTNPRLPPGQSAQDHRRRNHPGILNHIRCIRTRLRRARLTILKESAIQKPTKFHGPHWRRSGSTVIQRQFREPLRNVTAKSLPGLRSWLVNINWALVRPGSLETASLSA